MMGGGRGDRGFSNRDYSGEGIYDWEINTDFSWDIFTFVRVQYTRSGGFPVNRSSWSSYSNPYFEWRERSGAGWGTDHPLSDNNFAFRLQQLTSMEVNPDPIVLRLTDPELYNYPFLYMADPGYLGLSEAEVQALRKYLLNGGFLMMDDFWGDNEWENVYYQMKRVFPEREPRELELEHPIFNCVFVLKKKPQILNYRYAEWGRPGGITWERPDARYPHYMAIYDDKGRIMVLMCHNTDTGDGWELEGDNEWFFNEFSESQAYPLGINIVVFALTQ